MAPSVFSREELARVLEPLERAELLPPRAYLDPRVLELERREIFARSWLCVGRSDEIEGTGSWLCAPITPEGVIVARGPDLALHAFFNVCRHRGALLVSEPCGHGGGFVCPYHGWSYDLRGALRHAPHSERLENFALAEQGLTRVHAAEWKGFVFVNLEPAAPLDRALAPVPDPLARLHLRSLRLGRRRQSDVAANWKLLIENFQESHHFPSVHPGLHAHTPFEASSSWIADGAWLGGTMELVHGTETVSLDGQRHGRPLLGGIEAEDRRRVRDYFLWPNLLLSVQPDYLLSYRILPLAHDQSRIVADIYFHPEAFVDGFDPRDVYAFWDTTNAEDRAICASQQIGIGSAGYRRGRYVSVEDGTHAFDRRVAERYLAALERDAETVGR